MKKPLILATAIVIIIAITVLFFAINKLIPKEFIESVKSFVQTYGLWGTFVVAVLESFIFPIPTAVIIAPTTAFGADPLTTTIVATIGSVIGAFIGYFLGMKLGRPVAERLFSQKLKAVDKWFEQYGPWAVFIAAFTPIPFKVFTWAGGIARMDLRPFFLASVIGRFMQFIIAAYIGSILGGWVLALL